uniref:Protein kinase domain-containing protein n=1 Tax=Oryzias latipes TaxID=8090 RepID=A0A3P9JQJ7_ORYLA
MDLGAFPFCVHRDLAARNVLVCDNKLVKICDFSLARDLQKHQDYVQRGNTFMPLKWMSPESIFQNIYSSQSDVWSYGVLLWEIFSLGRCPYPDLQKTQEICSALKRGYRMTQPEHALPHIFELMQQCWEEDPLSRPSFSSLVISLEKIMSDGSRKSDNNCRSLCSSPEQTQLHCGLQKKKTLQSGVRMQRLSLKSSEIHLSLYLSHCTLFITLFFS